MKEANREVLDRGSLTALLAERARQASDVRLVLDAATGFIAAALVLVFRPPLWFPLTSLALSLGAFGAWGILDREANDATHGAGRHRTVIVARAVIAFLGALAAILGVVSLFFGLIGPWIS